MTHSLTNLGALAFARQKNALGFSYASGYPRTFVASGNGAANGTTIVSTGLAAYTSADSEICGLIVHVVKASNANSGELGAPIRSLCVGYVDSTGTLTVESLGFQTATGDVFSLLDPPTPWWCEDTGGSQTSIIDATRNEADDYWNGVAQTAGYYMTVRKASAVASTTHTLITDFVSSTGAATVASMGASTAVGDLYQAWKWPEFVSGYPLEVKVINRIDRGVNTGQFGKAKGGAGNATISGATEHIHRGPGTGRSAAAAELDDLYTATLDVATGTDYTVDSGSSTSSVEVTAGTPAQGGGWLSTSGDFFVATTTADPIVPYPNLRVAPASGETLTGLRKYVASDAVNHAIAIQQWLGKESYDLLVGGVCSLKWSFERDNYLRVAAAWTFADGMRRTVDESNGDFSRAFDPKRSTVTPRALHDARCVLGGVDLELVKFEFDLGVDLQLRQNLAAPGNVDAVELRNFDPKFTMGLHLRTDERDLMNDALYGQSKRLAVQLGDATADPGVWGLFCQEVEILETTVADDAGGLMVTVNGQVVVDPTSAMPWFAIYLG